MSVDICSLSTYLEVYLLGYMVISIFISFRNNPTFPLWLHHFLFLPAARTNSNFSTSSLKLIIFCFFNNSHFNGCEIVGLSFSLPPHLPPTFLARKTILFEEDSGNIWKCEEVSLFLMVKSTTG